MKVNENCTTRITEPLKSFEFSDHLTAWFRYNLLTVMTIMVICVAQMAFGSLVRWEVGDIQYSVASDPVSDAALNKGWVSHSCFPVPIIPGQPSLPYDILCGFNKGH